MGGAATFHFWLFSALALVAALGFVTRRNPVSAALWLVNVMFALAGLYVILGAHYLGAVQVLVYAGAIMVVFVFVVMLLNLGDDETPGRLRWRPAAGSLAGLAFALVLLQAVRQADVAGPAAPVDDANAVLPVATSLFTEHLVAFEVTSLLLLVAVVGSVVLAKRSAQHEVRS
jgi:NADH-quinone oxidoreductase subunit J